MTMYAKLSKTGEIKLPEAILEHIKAEDFIVSLQGEKVVLSPRIKIKSEFVNSNTKLTPAERAAEFQIWMTRIETDTTREQTNISNEDLRRQNMYEDRI